jgi:shikimate dehydrogenase
MTRPYAEVIGDPIAQSKSPLIHNFWLEKRGIDAEYRPCHVPPAALASYFASRSADLLWRGCNITIPHKEHVSAFADVIDAKAKAIGASNCLFRDDFGGLVATNTDVDGVAEAIAGCELGISGLEGSPLSPFRLGTRCREGSPRLGAGRLSWIWSAA